MREQELSRIGLTGARALVRSVKSKPDYSGTPLRGSRE